jgi:hypothetical protein
MTRSAVQYDLDSLKAKLKGPDPDDMLHAAFQCERHCARWWGRRRRLS